MLIVDIVLILVLAGFIVSGYKQGFILTLGRLIAAVLGFLAARAWSGWLAVLITIFLPKYPGWSQVIAFIIILFIVERALGFLVSLINTVFKIITLLPLISSINALLGAVVGLAEGVVFVGSALYIILLSKPDPTLVLWINQSTIAHDVQLAFQWVLKFL